MNYGYYHYGFTPTLGIFGIIISVLWWFIIISVIVSFFRLVFGRHHWHGQIPENDTDEALKILKSRYAKGEISKKEFDAIKKDIS